MSGVSAAPLQIEEVIAAKREGTQHHDVGVHPQPAVLVQGRVAKDVAEVSYLRARENLLVERARDYVVRRAKLDSVGCEKRELLGRVTPDANGMPCPHHRGGCGDQAWMLCGFGEHFVEAVNLRQRRVAIEVALNSRIERTRQL